MKNPIIIGLASIALTGSALALEIPKFKIGQDYAIIRKHLLKTGWSPVHRKGADNCYHDDATCKGRPEMLRCAGTGDGNCKFLWHKKQKIIAICTVGDIDNATKFDAICDPE